MTDTETEVNEAADVAADLDDGRNEAEEPVELDSTPVQAFGDDAEQVLMPKARTLADYFEKEQPQSILVYGASKVGKTRLVSQLVKDGYYLLWIDTERGIQTLRSLLTPEELRRIIYLQILDTTDKPTAVATVGRFFAARSPINICYEHGEVSCGHPACKQPDGYYRHDPAMLTTRWVVVLDSLTQVSLSALSHATAEKQKLLLTQAAKADWDEYAYQGALLSKILSHLQIANYHRVVISHDEVIEQADGTELLYPTCGTRKFSRNVAKYFDHIVYLFRKNRQHGGTSSTGYKASIMAGSRSDLDVGADGARLSDLLRNTSKEALKARREERAAERAASAPAKPQSAANKLSVAGLAAKALAAKAGNKT